VISYKPWEVVPPVASQPWFKITNSKRNSIDVSGWLPMLAPTIGGYVTAAYGWHVAVLILMGIGL
jgi:hypothetical protein